MSEWGSKATTRGGGRRWNEEVRVKREGRGGGGGGGYKRKRERGKGG